LLQHPVRCSDSLIPFYRLIGWFYSSCYVLPVAFAVGAAVLLRVVRCGGLFRHVDLVYPRLFVAFAFVVCCSVVVCSSLDSSTAFWLRDSVCCSFCVCCLRVYVCFVVALRYVAVFLFPILYRGCCSALLVVPLRYGDYLLLRLPLRVIVATFVCYVDDCSLILRYGIVRVLLLIATRFPVAVVVLRLLRYAGVVRWLRLGLVPRSIRLLIDRFVYRSVYWLPFAFYVPVCYRLDFWLRFGYALLRFGLDGYSRCY